MGRVSVYGSRERVGAGGPRKESPGWDLIVGPAYEDRGVSAFAIGCTHTPNFVRFASCIHVTRMDCREAVGLQTVLFLQYTINPHRVALLTPNKRRRESLRTQEPVTVWLGTRRAATAVGKFIC